MALQSRVSVYAVFVSAIMGVSAPSSAQKYPPPSLRLTVRPHEMKLGTRNAPGQYRLNRYKSTGGIIDIETGTATEQIGTSEDSIYIPPSAAGKRRVPLVAIFGGIDRWRVFADYYGVLIVSLDETFYDVRGYDLLGNSGRAPHKDDGVTPIDAALRRALTTYAVDPDKIALGGMSNGGNLALLIGCRNPDVFSRIVIMSAQPSYEYPSCVDTMRPFAARTQFYVNMGISEAVAPFLDMTSKMRRDGHTVRLALNLREHIGRQQDFGDVLQWLADSWHLSRADTNNIPTVDTVAPLTPDILTKMTTFWTSVRQRHPLDERALVLDWPIPSRKTVVIPVGREKVRFFELTDFQAMAARDSAIPTLLESAGLTALQEEAYEVALVSARATLVAQEQYASPREFLEEPPRDLGAVRSIPSVERNVTFLREHKEKVTPLLKMFGIPLNEES